MLNNQTVKTSIIFITFNSAKLCQCDKTQVGNALFLTPVKYLTTGENDHNDPTLLGARDERTYE